MADVTEQTPLAAPEQRPKRKGLVAAVAAVSLARRACYSQFTEETLEIIT